MSDILELIAGILISLFTLSFLLFEQWHLPPEDPLHLPDQLFSDELHFLFNDGVFRADEPCAVNEERNELDGG